MSANAAATCRAFGERLDATDARIASLGTRFDGLETRFDGLKSRFDNLESRFDALGGRFDALEVRLDTRIDAMDRVSVERFAAVRAEIARCEAATRAEIDKSQASTRAEITQLGAILGRRIDAVQTWAVTTVAAVLIGSGGIVASLLVLRR